MSLLTDEGLPDPGNMNFLAQLTLGPIEQWFSQTQETLANFGLGGVGTGTADFLAGGATDAAGAVEGWSGQDAEMHRALVQQDLELAQQHTDWQHRAAEAILWAVDTLQLVMTILLIIQILRIAIMLASTALAFLTAGVSEVAAGEMTVQMLIFEAVKRAIIFVLRSLLKLVFWVLRQALKNAVGTLAGGTAGALVAYNTVSSEHLSGGDAFWTYVQDIGFGALTGATMQAGIRGGIAAGGSAVWKVLGLNAGGAAVAGAQMWAQSETTGQPLTAQTVFSDLTADIGLPEGALAARHEVNAVFAARGEQAAAAAQEGLRLSKGVDPASRPWDFTSVTGRDVTPPLGNETQCAQAAMHDTAAQAGVKTSISDLADASGYVPGKGTWLSDAPTALGKAMAGDPGAFERIAGHPTALSRRINTLLANGDRAGAEAAAASAVRADGGFTVADLDVRYRASKLPSTVVLNLEDGPHAVQFYGSFGKDVRLFDPSRGEAYTMSTAKFLDVWHGGQALVPDLGALEVEPARVAPMQRAAQRIVDPLGRRGVRLEEAPELQVAGRDPAKARAKLEQEVTGGISTKVALSDLEKQYPGLSRRVTDITSPAAVEQMNDITQQIRVNVYIDEELARAGGNQLTDVERQGMIDRSTAAFSFNSQGDFTHQTISRHPGDWDALAYYEDAHQEVAAYTKNLATFGYDPSTLPNRPDYNFSNANERNNFYSRHAERQAWILEPDGAQRVSRPTCADCRLWFQSAAKYRGSLGHLDPLVIADPDVTRIFFPDGQVGVVVADGSGGISDVYVYDSSYASAQFRKGIPQRTWMDLP